MFDVWWQADESDELDELQNKNFELQEKIRENTLQIEDLSKLNHSLNVNNEYYIRQNVELQNEIDDLEDNLSVLEKEVERLKGKLNESKTRPSHELIQR